MREAAEVGFGFPFGPIEVALFPHVRIRENIDLIVSLGVGPPWPGRAPRGINFEQSCSSLSRCFKQYFRLHLSQWTAGSFAVSMSVLHEGWEHCIEL